MFCIKVGRISFMLLPPLEDGPTQTEHALASFKPECKPAELCDIVFSLFSTWSLLDATRCNRNTSVREQRAKENRCVDLDQYIQQRVSCARTCTLIDDLL